MRRHAPLLVLLAAVGALYALTAARVVLPGDNGEFATLFAVGGVAHPSGYPLYVMLLRLAASLPAASPAHGAALATAAIALGAVAALRAAALSWGADRTSASLAAVVFGLSPRFWDLGTQAEVFALHAALSAVLLALSAPALRLRGERRVALLGVVAGLAASNNLTVVLLAPVVGWGAALGVRESARPARAVALGAATTLVGLSPYVWMMHAARVAGPSALVWGDVTSWAGLLRHAARVDYGTFTHATGAAAVPAGVQLAALARHLFADLRWLPAAIGLAAVPVTIATARRSGDRGRARAVAALSAALLVAGPGFATVSNVTPEGPGLAVLRRFYVLPELVLALLFALGSAEVLSRRPASPALRGGLVAGALLLATVLTLPVVEGERQPTLERYLVDTLRSVPEGSVVLGTGDDRVFGFAYAQRALGVRPDVLFVSPVLLHHDWYRARVSDALGAPVPPPSGGSVDTVALAGVVHGTGRPLFLAEPLGGAILRAFPSYPVGTVQRVLPRGGLPPPPAWLEQENTALFERFAPRPAVRDTSPWAPPLREAYARPWRVIADAYARVGDLEAAERCRARAAALID